MASRLCTKKDSKFVEMSDLRLLPEPEALGSRHKPIHPARLVETVLDTIKAYDREVDRVNLSLNGKRTRLAATVDIKPFEDNAESGYSIGFISSINESAALRFVGGQRIFVCENLCVNGEVIQLRRHTTGLNLEEEIHGKIGKALDACKSIDEIKALHQGISVDELRVYELAGRALSDDLLPAAKVRDAVQWWTNKTYPDTQERTLWGVNNAFTRAVNELVPNQRIQAATDVANFLKTYQRRLA